MSWSVKTVNQIELKWSPYWCSTLVNSGFRNINLAANIPLLFTSCSRILKCLIVNCPYVKCGTKYQSSRKKCVPQDSRSCPWQKYWKPLYVLFLPLSIENTSTWYGRLCRTRAFCRQRLSGPQCYLYSFQLFEQKRWSRGRFNRFLPLLVKDPFV